MKNDLKKCLCDDLLEENGMQWKEEKDRKEYEM